MASCANCCFLLITLLVILIAVGYQAYINYGDVIFKTVINRSFNTFDYGTLCIKYKSNPKLMNRFGKYKDTIKGCSATIILNDEEQFYRTLAISGGNIGLGEAYFLKYWDVERDTSNPNDDTLSETVFHFMKNRLRRKQQWGGRIMDYLFAFKSWYQTYLRFDLFTSLHSKEDDLKSVQAHYDLGNDFYQSFLGDSLCGYSCGIWNDESDKTNEDVQNNKWDIIINKAKISNTSPKLKVLDIGCGWGYFPSYINNKTDSFVVGITISENQFNFMNNKYRNQVKDKKILFNYLDYRDLKKQHGANYFDRAVSIGMLEHVGYDKLDEYFQSVWDVLKPGSYFLLHYISRTDIHPDYFQSSRSFACRGSNYISTYIFPNGCLVPADWVWESADKIGFVKLHQEFYGHHYSKTLNLWKHNLVKNWPQLQKNNKNYDEKLYKIYEFYLAYCEAVFRTGRAELVQQLFYKPTDIKEYKPNKWDHGITLNPNIKLLSGDKNKM